MGARQDYLSCMSPFLEHLNMTSTDVAATVAFLQTAMPEFRIRGEGHDGSARYWVHLGTDTTYLAIEDRGATEKGPHEPYIHPGINHMGFVVSGVAAVAERMRAAGYREGMTDLDHPHRHRYYFFDQDDNEYEFVEYLSDQEQERNDYAL